MSMFRRPFHEVPQLNTSSLPDLIFTVLFFFMIVTHMRKVAVKVEYQEPQGTQLTRLTKKSTISYIYIGRPMHASATGNAASADACVQLNDKVTTPDAVADYMAVERKRMSPEDLGKMMVSIKADKNTRMGIITDVKEALREANVLKINYSAVEEK